MSPSLCFCITHFVAAKNLGPQNGAGADTCVAFPGTSNLSREKELGVEEVKDRVSDKYIMLVVLAVCVAGVKDHLTS